MPHTSYPSRHAIGDKVALFLFNDRPDARINGVVKGIKFTESKVTYDVDLDMGGERLLNVDSTFVANDNVQLLAA